MRAPVRVAVIGAGYFGQFHYDAWSRIDEAEVVSICVPDPAEAAETARRYGTVGQPLPVFADPTEMMHSVGPGLVDITAPPAAHLPLIERLAPFGVPVICQKPFCGSAAGAREAIALSEVHGFPLAVHENVRFQPWYREAKRLIETGAVGQLYQVTFRLRPGDGQGLDAYLDRQPYFQKMPRFLVHETAIHWVDTFRYLMGEPTGVFARLARLNPEITGEDAGVVLFDFEGGARGLFDGNRLANHVAENRRLTMGEMWTEGSEGTLRLDGEGRLWLRSFGANDETEQKFPWRDHLFGGDCVYLTCHHIIDAWIAGRQPETEARAYLRNQQIEEAIYESAETGNWIAL